MNFMIADVTYFVSGTMITFSQRGATKIKSEQFSEFGSRTNRLLTVFTEYVSKSNDSLIRKCF